MRLKLLADEHRLFFQTLRAKRFPVKTAMKHTYAEYPDAHDYPYETWLAYDKTPQAAEEYKKALAGVREKAVADGYAEHGSRVDTLVEMADVFVRRFRLADEIGDPLDSTEITRLAKEIREIMREIRIEVEPFAGLGEEMSGYERLMRSVKNMSAEARELLALPVEPSEPS
jgi:hypothetical protein